jgi:hypothetical protein
VKEYLASFEAKEESVVKDQVPKENLEDTHFDFFASKMSMGILDRLALKVAERIHRTAQEGRVYSVSEARLSGFCTLP